MKNWHIIEEYKAQADTILCACGWLGKTGYEWNAHRKENEGQIAPKEFNRKAYLYAPGNYPRTIKLS